MEKILFGIMYLMCFAMAAIGIIFALKFLKEVKEREVTKSLAFRITFCVIILSVIAFIVLPFLDLFGILS